MAGSVRSVRLGWVIALVLSTPLARADVLTVDKAVEMALARSTTMVNAEANVVNARSGVYSAYSGVLPSLSADWSRSGDLTTHSHGQNVFGTQVFLNLRHDSESYSAAPTLSGTWPILNLSALQGLRSAHGSLEAARYRRSATRAEVALDTRGLFYGVVRAEHLSVVANESVRLARDDERRVRALFEVGSVSKSDLLKAQVRTAQAQLDSISRHLDITNQRVTLSRQIGLPESAMGEVDTVLTEEPRTYEEPALLAEARQNRPDLKAAEADLKAARRGLTAANLSRLPFLSLNGSADFNPKSTFKNHNFISPYTGADTSYFTTGSSQSDRDLRGSVAVTWNFFSGMRTEANIASARARVLVAQDTRDVVVRNLEAEVHAALLSYLETVAALEVAERGLASAEESVRLTQQKYNVGSATILELIDAQVQLQQARSDRVSALAGIRLAEATLNRVRGHGE